MIVREVLKELDSLDAGIAQSKVTLLGRLRRLAQSVTSSKQEVKKPAGLGTAVPKKALSQAATAEKLKASGTNFEFTYKDRAPQYLASLVRDLTTPGTPKPVAVTKPEANDESDEARGKRFREWADGWLGIARKYDPAYAKEFEERWGSSRNPVKSEASEINDHVREQTAPQITEEAKPTAPTPAQAEPKAYNKEDLFKAIAREKLAIAIERGKKKLAQAAKARRAAKSARSSNVRTTPGLSGALRHESGFETPKNAQEQQNSRDDKQYVHQGLMLRREQYPQYDQSLYQEQYARYVRQYNRWLYWARQQQAAGLPWWPVASNLR